MYNLFYNLSVPVKSLIPKLSLDECLQGANTGNLSYRTKLVRLNWMIQDLKHNDILKPLLINQDLQVLTGDTRLMALSFYPKKSHVPVLISGKYSPFDNSILIENKKHLADLLGATEDDILTDCNWHEQQLNWLEVAFIHVKNHMHDEQQRARMIRNYLKQYPNTIFDRAWCQTFIDWSRYDNLSDH